MTRLIRDESRLLIRVCCGLHCGPAGGRSVLHAFEEALTAYRDQVEIVPAHCLGACQDGPCVRIAGERFYHITPADVPDLVREEVLPRL